ncbi:hypothetical protein Sste5344_003275 [Sporothrix stenoceras]
MLVPSKPETPTAPATPATMPSAPSTSTNPATKTYDIKVYKVPSTTFTIYEILQEAADLVRVRNPDLSVVLPKTGPRLPEIMAILQTVLEDCEATRNTHMPAVRRDNESPSHYKLREVALFRGPLVCQSTMKPIITDATTTNKTTTTTPEIKDSTKYGTFPSLLAASIRAPRAISASVERDNR